MAFLNRVPVLLFLSLVGIISEGVHASLLDIPLKNLITKESEILYRARPQIVMFYQPDCRWCGLQMGAMQDVQAACPNVLMQLVGIRGASNRLVAELRRHRTHLPAFEGTRELVRRTGGVEATPLTLIFNAEGEEVARQRGYLDKARLLSIAHRLDGATCEVSSE